MDLQYLGDQIMKKLILVMTLFTFSASTTTFAKDSSSGCGPGWYIFKKNSLVSSFLREITNTFLYPFVTLGMTLGTSECSKHSIVKKDKDSLEFLAHNFDDIMLESSMGDGKFLTGFSKTFNCTSEEQIIFKAALKSNYKRLFTSDMMYPTNTLLNIIKIVRDENNICKA